MFNKTEVMVLERYKVRAGGSLYPLLEKLNNLIERQELDNFVSKDRYNDLVILKEIRRKVREAIKHAEADRKSYYIVAIIIMTTLSVLLYQTVISQNIYSQLNTIQRELVILSGQVRELKVDNEPLLYFIEEVNKYQKLLEEER